MIDIRITQFPLHPDTPEEGLTLEELFSGKNFDVGAAMSRMAALLIEEGLPCGDRTMTYNSRLAQELASWASSTPDGDGVHAALFRAYFVDNTNLARIEELVRVAEQQGLSASEAQKVLASRRFRDAVDADWSRSRELGIKGIPSFVIGDQTVNGAQPYEALEEFVVGAGAVMRKDGARRE